MEACWSSILRRFDCIFLSNVAQFTAGEAHGLANYVRGGGGLVFFLGDRVDAALYNQQLGGGRPGWPRLLPTLLDAPSGAGHVSFRSARNTPIRWFTNSPATREPAC